MMDHHLVDHEEGEGDIKHLSPCLLEVDMGAGEGMVGHPADTVKEVEM